MTTAGDCKNCGAALAGRYCSACGQQADVGIPSLGSLLGGALGDLYNFDSRLWRSLLALARRPGLLTNLYLAGQRESFTPPFRMYVVTSVVFFVLFSLLRPASSPPAPVAVVGGDAATPAAAEPAAAAAEGTVTSLGITVDDDDLECSFDARVGPALRERLAAACERVEANTPESFGRAFADNVPVMMLVFIPIAAAIMKLLYLLSNRKYVEHVLFFAHVHTFFFLLATIAALLAASTRLPFVPDWAAPVLLSAAGLYFFVYLYAAMRRVYGQSHARTAAKYVALGGSYLLALSVTLMVTVIMTALSL